MAETVVSIILVAVVVYVALGALFTILFQIKGLHKIDEATHGSPIGFRLIIIPGCLLLWPALLAKWIKTSKQSPVRVIKQN